MKTAVSSLVATSTVGIAAAGLALGKPDRTNSTRPSSKRRKAGDLADVIIHNQDTSSPLSRPATSSTVITPDTRHQRPRTVSSTNPSTSFQSSTSSTKVDLPPHSSGRLSSFKQEDYSSSPQEIIGGEPRRESFSSRGSWMRRLSNLPNSYNNSPRASIGPESALASSHTSAALILSSSGTSPTHLAPNKLVKRTPSDRSASGEVKSKSGSKPHVPTLRRPATSHQRSVTLHQQFKDESMVKALPTHQTPVTTVHTTPSSNISTPEGRQAWKVYFEARPTKLSKEKPSNRTGEATTTNFLSTSKRVIPDSGVKPTLLKPELITRSKSESAFYYDDSFGLEDDELDDVDKTAVPFMETPEDSQNQAKRSSSMQFGSPTSWMTRSSSLRGNKRNTEGRSGGKRYASAPISTKPSPSITTAQGSTTSRPRSVMDPRLFQRWSQPTSPVEESSTSDPFAESFQSRIRNSSSPLPPLSRLSSFNLDVARLGLSSSSSSAPRQSPTSPTIQTNTTTTSLSSIGDPSPASTYFGSIHIKNHRHSNRSDLASTLVESDNDGKGCISADEDDIDFQSETVYDSLRSGATGSVRSQNPPLDAMFDESPPSLNGHAKSKRLSIHEMLANGGYQEVDDRIIEEDEGMSTPVRPARSSQEDAFQTPVRRVVIESHDAFSSSPPSFSLATKDFGRLSLDDEEEDEDWTKDDENVEISNSLSPPHNSINSRRVSPSVRAALADVTHTGTTNGNPVYSNERPKSNLFDWSEPSTDRLEFTGNSLRPKTSYVKHLADGRGGRTIGRKGPSALHIRSQSVPVVPDLAGQRDTSKLTPKFGTWGLGGKGVSEDWDGDFEFDNDDHENGEAVDISMETSGMLVPPSIQASQASVVGHVGQIREICLLVEDLKRLRLQGKEKNLLNGRHASYWKEAEGIIALAVPDEEDPTLSSPHSPSSGRVDHRDSGDKFHEHGPDVEDVSMPDTPIEVLNRYGKPTGFVYDGNIVRRRSVFLPGDDIFGAGTLQNSPTSEHLKPPTNSPRFSLARSASDTARSVMETMHQHRSTSDPLLQNPISQSSDKMPFDTTSLKDLVNKASQLTRTLADIIRKHDGSLSPDNSPHRDSSPAFTRVFTDPSASPPKHLLRSHSNNSMPSGSIDSSPTQSLGSRMHMMTVV